MGKVKKETKKKEETPNSSVKIKEIKDDIEKLGQWVADLQQDFERIDDLLGRLAKRMGLEWKIKR